MTERGMEMWGGNEGATPDAHKDDGDVRTIRTVLRTKGKYTSRIQFG